MNNILYQVVRTIMPPKKTTILLMGLTILLLTNLLSPTTTAQNPNITISEIKHQLINTETIGARLAHYFTFWITFTNTGDIASNNITAYLEDPELNARLEINSFTLQPHQNITLIYEEWPTTLLGQTTINITYNPTEADVEQTQYNTGKKPYTFQIGSPTNTEETPGFHLMTFVISLLIFIIFKRKIRKCD